MHSCSSLRSFRKLEPQRDYGYELDSYRPCGFLMNPMKHAVQINSSVLPTSGHTDESLRQPSRKHSRRQPGPVAKRPSSSSKVPRRRKKTTNRESGIRETEDARALLEKQLHTLYWWVFNAFKMKGFTRAKALDELQRAAANGTETRTEHQVLPAEPL